MNQPILVLCFNVPLAARLRQMLDAKGLQDQVVVRHFHGWCDDLLRSHQIPKPSWNQFPGDAYLEELVARVVRSIEAGHIPAGQYGAVMVDEAHDFQPDWLKLVVQMVDPATNSLLILYDDAQTLYGRKRKQKINFKQVGIQAQGRTTVLKLNYRNTAEVLGVAYEFAKAFFGATGTANEDEPMLVQPQSAGRHGAKPTLTRFSSFQHETEGLVDRIRLLQGWGLDWNQIAVVYRSKFMGERIYQHLQQAQIPVEWISRDRDSRHYNPTELSVKLITMHSSKGLEFPVVFIPGLGFLPSSHSPPEEEARLLYVAMIRAIDRLVLSCDRSSDFVTRIEAALHMVKE